MENKHKVQPQGVKMGIWNEKCPQSFEPSFFIVYNGLIRKVRFNFYYFVLNILLYRSIKYTYLPKPSSADKLYTYLLLKYHAARINSIKIIFLRKLKSITYAKLDSVRSVSSSRNLC